MQIDGVRHDGGADDADREQQRPGVGDLRQHAVHGHGAPIDRSDEYLDQIAQRNDADQGADDQLERAEPEPFEHQDPVSQDPGDDHPGEQRHPRQQRQSDGAAEEFGEIGRHGGDLADDPHGPDDRPRKFIAAHFREVASGDDAELGREGLEQHGDQIGQQHDPEQAVAVFGARLDVGREISGIHVGDRGDHGRTGEWQIGAHAPPPAGQNLARRRRRPLRERAPHGDRFRQGMSARVPRFGHLHYIANCESFAIRTWQPRLGVCSLSEPVLFVR